MLRIDIEDTKVTEKKGTSRGGQPYSIREQAAYAHLLDRDGNAMKYPVAITVSVPDGKEPYPVGQYTLGDGSFIAGEYGRLGLGRVSLVRVEAKRAQAVA